MSYPFAGGSCGNCGSATCNTCRAARGLGPAGVTPAKRKPKTLAERGYRVCSYDDFLNAPEGSKPGETYSIPDTAIRKARAMAKREQRSVLIFRDGVRWQIARKDGAVDPA